MFQAAVPVLHVADAAAAREFYGRLGFGVRFQVPAQPGRPGPVYVGLARDGVEVHLSTHAGDGAAGAAVYLRVRSVDALYDELRRRGVGVEMAPTDQDWGMREVYVRDPDGNSIRFGSPIEPAPPRMYAELASWWPLLSAPEEYAEEAAFFEGALVEACEGAAETLLELGSGGGNSASYLKARFRAVLVDLSPGMLEVSRRLNPECEHVRGDMRSVRLGRRFDCVFVHDAVAYMATEDDLRKAIETAFVHCRPGGSAVFAPDHLKENFRESTDCAGHDGERQSLRYMDWMWDPDPYDTSYVVDYAYLLRGEDGEVRVMHDRHVEGLFSRADWLRLLAEAGFRAHAVRFDHSELEPGTYEVFVATRPVETS